MQRKNIVYDLEHVISVISANHGTAKSTGAGSCPSKVTPKKNIGH